MFSPFHWRDLTPLFDNEPIAGKKEFVAYTWIKGTRLNWSTGEYEPWPWKQDLTPLRVFVTMVEMKGKITC